MKSLRSPLWCALALWFAPSLASADEPTPAAWVVRQVQAGLLAPLAKHEGNGEFSRSRRPPRERKVRALQTALSTDKHQRPFVPFAIDVRFGSEWRENDIVGCAYRNSGEIFVKIGDEYRPSQFLLGKDVKPVAGVCEPAPPKAASRA